ncbi:hypothetical protein [Seonamhaeicola aphaedonensis]|uniref:Long-subunit fatty acid transport protein n=1 Tax=Seonamhaeicola aphaedonensis TaxID=1461338 RepID=A0A3D9HL49_9FLAO|nr:hypothetical protein [Seonamhaeicola aphaedonensis]RED50204.1 long-subunit fatty acid transport protein [Seonamhaeicola aphaedonensis]
MIKKLVLVFTVFIAIYGYAQEGTASPYSFYGIGSLKFKGTVENRSMGGIGVYIDSIHVNLRNPASYATDNLSYLNDENRPVKFTVGGSHSSINLEGASESDKTSSTTFDYVALTVPMGEFGFGFGLLPYTSVGYKLESLNDDNNIENRFTGEGGLNKAFFGLGYRVAKGLSIGIDAQYNFGSVRNSTVEYLYDDGIPTQFQSRENNRSDLSGLNFNIGLSYGTLITESLELATTFTYTPESTLVSKNERSIATITTNANTGREFVNDLIDIDLEALGLLETDLVLPSKISFGLGIGKPRNWFVGGEYTLQKTSQFSNPLYSSASTSYEDASTISFGGFYIPDYNSLNNYLKRTIYRAGVRYEKTGLNLNTESIDEFGISFGVGLPLRGGLSSANVGLELGKRGTTNSNLIQENFINLQLSLSLGDIWFQKRKYN